MEFLTFARYFEMSRHRRFLCNHWTKFNSAMLIFLFFDEDYAPGKKNWAHLPFWALLGHFSDYLFPSYFQDFLFAHSMDFLLSIVSEIYQFELFVKIFSHAIFFGS